MGALILGAVRMKFLYGLSIHVLFRFVIFSFPLVVSACAPLEQIKPDAFALTRPASLVSWVATQAPGARAVIDDPEFGDGVTVLVERTYYSASGLTCKRARVTVNGPPSEPVAVCEIKGEEWFLAPRIWGGAPARGGSL
jgi:hypothetical protein